MEISPKVSVIIPMFNVAEKLCNCIQSLAAQSLSDLEIIFIDDKSTDNTLSSLYDYIENSSLSKDRIKLILHDVNKGVAAARNTGLENATGEFIYYVDADDFIESNTLERLYTKAKDENLDIVGSEWFLTYYKNERHVKMPDAKTGMEMFILMTNGTMRWNLWLFLAKRELYIKNNIRFIAGMNMGEDMMVMMKLALCANKTSIIHTPFYHYIQTNSDSLTKNYQKYQQQITANIDSLDCFIRQNSFDNLAEQINKLKLAVKLPLLISSKNEDFEKWNNWFKESNYLAGLNYGVSWRTYLLQRAALTHNYWYIKLYYLFIIRFIYSIIYK